VWVCRCNVHSLNFRIKQGHADVEAIIHDLC
jgi:hypothetical protein